MWSQKQATFSDTLLETFTSTTSQQDLSSTNSHLVERESQVGLNSSIIMLIKTDIFADLLYFIIFSELT